MKVTRRGTNAAIALGVALAIPGTLGVGTATAGPIDGTPAVQDAPIAVPDRDEASGDAGASAIAVRDGRHALWIDRVELPAYARDLYDRLVEATDADGVGDLLIEERPFEGGAPSTTASWRVAGNVVASANGTYLTLGSAGSSSLTEASEAASVAFAAFDRDHPEVFWLTGSCRVGGFLDDGGELLVGFKLADPASGFDLRQDAFRDEGVLRSAIAERDGAIAAVLAAALDGGERDYETVFRLHGWLAANNAYNSLVAKRAACDDPLAWECLSALRGSSGEAGPTCEGYARAFKVLCDAAGIPCVLSRGLARHAPGADAERHMWNLVRVEGDWYGVDVTWDDAREGIPDRSHLLVGAGTIVGLEGAFATSHVVTDETFAGMVRLANEPAIARDRFVPEGTVAVRRLWNVSSGAHLLTADANEYRELAGAGEWRGEGVRFYGLATGGVPVRRLLNPSNGDHLYVSDPTECQTLTGLGWVDEGIAFRGAEGTGATPIYRLWNACQTANGGLGSHLWTEDADEYRELPLREPVGAWRRESVAWRAAWLP